MIHSFLFKRGYVYPISLFVVFLIHLATLQFPSAPDDAQALIYAMDGTVSYWQELLKGHFLFIEGLERLLTAPVYLEIVKGLIHLVGAGFFQIRLLNLLPSFCAIALLGWAFYRMGILERCFPGIYFYLLSTVAFITFHQGRPDGLNFLIFSICLIWFLFQGGRLTGVVCGFLLVAAIGIHLHIGYAMPLFPLLALYLDKKKAFSTPRYYWFFIGNLLGGVLLLTMMDPEKIGRHMAVLPKYVTDQLISNKIFRIIDLYDRLCLHLDTGAIFRPGWFMPVLTFYFLAGTWVIKYAAAYSESEKMIFFICNVLFVSFFFMLSHSSFTHTIYLHFFIYIVTGMTIYKLFTRELTLQGMDFYLWGFLGMFSVTIVDMPEYLPWFFLFLRFSIPIQKLPWKQYAVIGALLSFLVFYRFHYHAEVESGFSAFYLILFTLLPWVLFKSAPDGFRFRFSKIDSSITMAWIMTTLLIANMLFGLYKVKSFVFFPDYIAMNHIGRNLSKFDKVVAPNYLWFYSRKDNFQDYYALYQGKQVLVCLDISRRIIEYRPDYMVIPSGFFGLHEVLELLKYYEVSNSYETRHGTLDELVLKSEQ